MNTTRIAPRRYLNRRRARRVPFVLGAAGTLAVALAVALELDPRQTQDLLGRAGLALSRSSKFDVIVRFFLERGVHDVFRINEALFAYDQPLLGSMG